MQMWDPFHHSISMPDSLKLFSKITGLVMVGLLLYATYSRMYSNPASLFSNRPRQADPNALPWEEESLIVNRTLQAYDIEHKKIKPYPEQPKFEEHTYYTAEVYDHGDQRGELEFCIGSDGSIRGSWTADFSTASPPTNYKTVRGHYSHSVPNTFEGNIAPWKIYQDEYGQDKSMLYLITKGHFKLKAHNLESDNTKELTGYFYVTGWVDTEYNAAGELYIALPSKPWIDPATMTRHDMGEVDYLVFEWQGCLAD